MLWELIHFTTAHHGMALHVDLEVQTGSVLPLFASSLSFCVLDRAKDRGGCITVSVPQINSCSPLFWALMDSLNHVYSDLSLLWLSSAAVAFSCSVQYTLISSSHNSFFPPSHILSFIYVQLFLSYFL